MSVYSIARYSVSGLGLPPALQKQVSKAWSLEMLSLGQQLLLSETEGATRKACAIDVAELRVNFLLRFAAKPLFYWVVPSKRSEIRCRWRCSFELWSCESFLAGCPIQSSNLHVKVMRLGVLSAPETKTSWSCKAPRRSRILNSECPDLTERDEEIWPKCPQTLYWRSSGCSRRESMFVCHVWEWGGLRAGETGEDKPQNKHSHETCCFANHLLVWVLGQAWQGWATSRDTSCLGDSYALLRLLQ